MALVPVRHKSQLKPPDVLNPGGFFAREVIPSLPPQAVLQHTLEFIERD
jgi:hypothetical protein